MKHALLTTAVAGALMNSTEVFGAEPVAAVTSVYLDPDLTVGSILAGKRIGVLKVISSSPNGSYINDNIGYDTAEESVGDLNAQVDPGKGERWHLATKEELTWLKSHQIELKDRELTALDVAWTSEVCPRNGDETCESDSLGLANRVVDFRTTEEKKAEAAECRKSSSFGYTCNEKDITFLDQTASAQAVVIRNATAEGY